MSSDFFCWAARRVPYHGPCDNRRMTSTWEDFTWVVDDYGWVETHMSFTLVRNRDSSEVLRTMTTTTNGFVVGLDGVNADIDIIGVTQLHDWVLAVAPSTAGLDGEMMAPLSVGGEVVTCAKLINGDKIAHWVDGRATAFFDALLHYGLGFDETDSPWRDRMRTAGVDPDGEGPLPDGGFHVLEASLAMVSNYTGVSITRDLLRDAEFEIGDSAE